MNGGGGLPQTVLMSVRSPHVERILDGTKSIELRRRRWQVSPGATALLYASRDVRAIVGSFIVADTQVGTPNQIWRLSSAASCLTKREFQEYFSGATEAVAIHIGRVRSFETPVHLEELRRRWPGFCAPQSYRFLSGGELSELLNGERSQLVS